jgi:serine/threonine kinase 32
MGSMSFLTFTDNPFFRAIDFDALERKELEPVFVPSSEKTNFDATYDLEELLLEEAPLEARARRQKPREQLKDDATEKEIREEELYRMIENQFLSFDYTTAAYDRLAQSPSDHHLTLIRLARYTGALDPNNPGSPLDYIHPPPMPHDFESEAPARAISTRSHSRRRKVSKSQQSSLAGSPPLSNPPPMPNGQQVPPISSPRSQPYRQQFNPTSSAASPLSPYQQPYSRPQRPTGTRKESMGGGMQVVLDETGSWSDLAKQDTTLPADAKLVEAGGKPSGMLGFLSRKKGRGHSPKPQERGILGKEGARVVISNGE